MHLVRALAKTVAHLPRPYDAPTREEYEREWIWPPYQRAMVQLEPCDGFPRKRSGS